MTVRAKFYVYSIGESHSPKSVQKPDGSWESVPGKISTVVLQPVYGKGDPNHENSKFWAATPTGRIEFGCVNPEAVAQFEIGKEYYVDFTPAEASP